MLYFYHMNPINYQEIGQELQKHIKGDISMLDQDKERAARDTSLFYLLPGLVIYPKNAHDISVVLEYVSKKKVDLPALSVTMRAAGTCMTGGPLTESIVIDTTKYMNHVTDVNSMTATAEPGVFYRDFEKKTLEAGWIMPSYPASRELAAIGGIVSNNSGGEKTLTYGKTEKYVQSLDVLYANGQGDVLHAFTGNDLTVKLEEQSEGGRIHREMFALIDANYDTIMNAKPTVSKYSSYLIIDIP